MPLLRLREEETRELSHDLRDSDVRNLRHRRGIVGLYMLGSATFPDYELPDHPDTGRKLSFLQGDDPTVLMLLRDYYCSKDRQQLNQMVEFSKAA